MIFNDDLTLNYQQRMLETIQYLKYCQHKTQQLTKAEQRQVLQQCLKNRISRMPDQKKEILLSLQHNLKPRRNFVMHQADIEIFDLPAENIENIGDRNIHLAHSESNEIAEESQPPCINPTNNQKSLNDILRILYNNGPTQSGSHPEPRQIEEIIGTLLVLANRVKDSEYRLIDILPQLGDAFEAREEVIENVLAETIDNIFQLTDIEKFNDVKLKPSLNSPIKQKAYLYDLLLQNYQRLKSQNEKGVYINNALSLYRQKLKKLGISES